MQNGMHSTTILLFCTNLMYTITHRNVHPHTPNNPITIISPFFSQFFFSRFSSIYFSNRVLTIFLPPQTQKNTPHQLSYLFSLPHYTQKRRTYPTTKNSPSAFFFKSQNRIFLPNNLPPPFPPTTQSQSKITPHTPKKQHTLLYLLMQICYFFTKAKVSNWHAFFCLPSFLQRFTTFLTLIEYTISIQNSTHHFFYQVVCGYWWDETKSQQHMEWSGFPQISLVMRFFF